MLGHRHRIETFRTLGHIDVAAHEVHQVGALHQELRHPGVVVALARDVAIRAHLGFRRANGMRIVWAETEAAEPFRRNRLLHVIQPVAIGVLRADHHRAGGSRGRDAMLGHRAVDAQHVNVVAQHFEIVGGVIARGQAFVVQHGRLAIGRHGKMAAEATGGPGSVARVAGHAVVGMRQLGLVAGHAAPRGPVFQNRFRQPRFLVVMRIAGRDGVHHLHHFPRRAIFVHHGALVQLAVLPIKPALSPGRAQQRKIGAACRRRGGRSPAASPCAKWCRGNPRSRSPPRCASRRKDCRCRGCPARNGNRCSACPFPDECREAAPPSGICPCRRAERCGSPDQAGCPCDRACTPRETPSRGRENRRTACAGAAC